MGIEAGQRRINLVSGPDSIHGRGGRQSSHGNSWFWVYRCLTGRSGLDSLLARSDLGPLHVSHVWVSLHTLHADQVWIRSVPRR